MITKSSEMRQFPVKNLCEGEGEAVFTMPFPRGTLPRNVSMFTLAPGTSCGEHLHDQDAEVYYVLDGELVLLEDGKEYVLHAGDCEYCPIGHSHGAINRSDAPGTVLAIAMP